MSLRTKKWKAGLIGQTNGSKVVYLSADPNSGLLIADFHLYVEYYLNKVIQTI